MRVWVRDNLHRTNKSSGPYLLSIAIGKESGSVAKNFGQAHQLRLGVHSHRQISRKTGYPHLREKHQTKARLDDIELIEIGLRTELANEKSKEVGNETNVTRRLGLLQLHQKNLEQILQTGLDRFRRDTSDH